MQSKFFADKYDARVNAFIDAIGYYKKRLDVLRGVAENGEEFLDIVSKKNRPKLKRYLDFLVEKETEYQMDLEHVKNGIQRVLADKEKDLETLKRHARSQGISLSHAIAQVDHQYEKLGRINYCPESFTAPADVSMDDSHRREQEEARICDYLVRQGYSEGRAIQLSTGPWVDVALSEIERMVKK